MSEGTKRGTPTAVAPEQIIRESLEGAGCFTCECREAVDALVTERDGLEKTLTVMFEVLPKMITEAAQDFLEAYLDGRKPDLTEEHIAARMHRIVGEKFGAKS